MQNIENIEVANVFHRYPEDIRLKLLYLRQLIFEVASETENIDQLEETLKWGEPSYLVKGGSTVRLGWKVSNPSQYAMYFHCKTRLIEMFKMYYSDVFTFSGNRAITFNVDDTVPVEPLKHCIALSLTYHHIKQLSGLET